MPGNAPATLQCSRHGRGVSRPLGVAVPRFLASMVPLLILCAGCASSERRDTEDGDFKGTGNRGVWVHTEPRSATEGVLLRAEELTRDAEEPYRFIARAFTRGSLGLTRNSGRLVFHVDEEVIELACTDADFEDSNLDGGRNGSTLYDQTGIFPAQRWQLEVISEGTRVHFRIHGNRGDIERELSDKDLHALRTFLAGRSSLDER